MAIRLPSSSLPPLTSLDNGLVVKHVDADDGYCLDVPLLPDYTHIDQIKCKQYSVHEIPHGATFLRTCLNGLNALSGVGILSIPYALSEGGWLSLILLLMVAVICCYTGLLLQKCMGAASHIRSYPDIGKFAFGNKGRIAISFFMYLELYLVAVEFLILEGDNLANMFPNTSVELGGITKIQGKKLFVLLSALVILPTTWLSNLGILAFVSAGGVLASIITVVSVLYVGVFEGVGFHERGRLLNWSGLPTALGLYSFCYCGHAVFPTLCTSMKNKTQFSKVLVICFLLCTLNYGSMAVFGYLMYGEKLESQITLNLPKGSVGGTVAVYTTLINPFTKFALMISPMASAIEDRFLINSRGASMVIRTLLVTSTVVVALTVPFFAYLMALIGSFLSLVVSVLAPCLFYLKIFGVSDRSRLELSSIVGIFITGAFVAILGTYSSLLQILRSF